MEHDRIRILCAEDDPDYHLILQEALGMEGVAAETVGVYTGEDAMAHLQGCLRTGAQLPDLVLLDVRMPGKSGPEVLGEIRAHGELRHLPVLLLTGYTADQIAPESRVRADGVLSKSLFLPDLARELSGYIDALLGPAAPQGGRA